jgi:serine/threonine protein kinase
MDRSVDDSMTRPRMSPQESIAHYKIISKLGEGGMGAVYRATDTKLNRDVAIKVLPPAFAEDAARMGRFEREAQVLASLNHPNIAAIYGIEQNAIVMELVEGSELAGPVPIHTAIDYARQIAAGLEAAHERGIIHRDLKPANIKVTPDGVVKLLDFGLAKAREESASTPAANPTISPTLSLAMTQAGMILGTAAYMSPEQARGKPVDRRTDIWAFGVILFELLTGRHLYGGGETVTDTLAAVVLKEPDFSALPADTPAYLRRLIERCLRKDPKMRLRDIGEARILLDEPNVPSPIVPSIPQRTLLPWALAGVALLIAAIAIGITWMRPTTTDAGTGMMRFSIPLPVGTSWPTINRAANWVPSPDGRNLALVVQDGGGKSALWVRPLNATAAHRLDKTEGASFPFWSPDGQSIGFFAEDKLKRASLSGGVQKICDLPAAASPGDGGSWSKDNLIVFASPQKALSRVSAAGGIPAPATALEAGETSHSWPQFLPDGRHVLYLVRGGDPKEEGIYVQELGSPKRIHVMQSLTPAMWSAPGYLLFTREGNLFAQRMNSTKFQLEGEPFSVAEDVPTNDSLGRSAFAVSQNGVLLYRSGQRMTSDRQISWRDRDGKVLNAVGKPGRFTLIILSPDQKLGMMYVDDPSGRRDAWMMDITNGVIVPKTQDGRVAPSSVPVWSPDSKYVAIATLDGLQELNVADGKLSVLTKELLFPEDWSPDGRSVLCRDADLTRLSLVSLADGFKVQPIITTPYRVVNVAFSPDAKYVAYGSFETGQQEIYIASFPSFSMKRKVSSGGANYPVWGMTGKKLFYHASDGTVVEAAIRIGSEIEITDRKALFKFGTGGRGERFGVSADGQRFFINDAVSAQIIPELLELSLVINWAAEITYRQ